MRDPLRARLCPLLPLLLPVLPKLSGAGRDRWAEWLLESRYEGRSEREVAQMRAFLEDVRERVLDRARIRSHDVVLDVGTGTGLLALGALERLGDEGEVVALDVSVDCLEELRRACSDPRVWYQVGSAEVVPLPDSSVDVVMTRSVLIYVEDKAEAAREFFRVLRMGGRISIFEPVNRRNTELWELVDFAELESRVIEDFNRRWPPDNPMRDFDVDDMVRFFRDAGFGGVEAEVRVNEEKLTAEAVLRGVSAPGRPPLIQAWHAAFSPDEVERLEAAVREAEPIVWTGTALYLSAHKP